MTAEGFDTLKGRVQSASLRYIDLDIAIVDRWHNERVRQQHDPLPICARRKGPLRWLMVKTRRIRPTYPLPKLR
jgi:hypothetical protein